MFVKLCQLFGGISMIKHEISHIQKNSIAEQLEITSGDFLVSINGQEVKDILDYRLKVQEEILLVEIEKPDGELWELDIEKEADEDLGLSFMRRCKNKCIFCFVDQQPKGLRESLYVKDDDPLMSFVLGNYTTLTNLDEAEIKRLTDLKISPLRISVHTTDMDLREKMMGTKFARNLLDALAAFNKAGIEMHFQIVLCKGVNDGDKLTESIKTLHNLGKSLSVVPAGLTKHREGLHALEPFSKEEAAEVIKQVNALKLSEFVYLSDEWYLLAGQPLPKYMEYNDFPQLDNGVGMIRLFEREFMGQLKKAVAKPMRKTSVGLITGKAAGRFMRFIAGKFMALHPAVKIEVFEIENSFFGKNVTVSGLLTGQDIIKQLKGKYNVDMFYLPENAFRAGVEEKVMLDGVTLAQLSKALGVPVCVGSADGAAFCRQLRK